MLLAETGLWRETIEAGVKSDTLGRYYMLLTVCLLSPLASWSQGGGGERDREREKGIRASLCYDRHPFLICTYWCTKVLGCSRVWCHRSFLGWEIFGKHPNPSEKSNSGTNLLIWAEYFDQLAPRRPSLEELDTFRIGSPSLLFSFLLHSFDRVRLFGFQFDAGYGRELFHSVPFLHAS